MDHDHVASTGLPDRLTIDEAADLIVKETEKPRDYVLSFLADCAEQGFFSAVVQQPTDHANVSHISRVDSTRSTVSTAELIEWLNDEIEEAHQRAREAIAHQESQKWGYEARPQDMHVRLLPWSQRLASFSSDDTISMTTRNWVEYLTQEIAERQGWIAKEREAKCAIARAEYLNLFVGLANTLPLVQELTRSPWKGTQLQPDWLTSLHMVRADLREWAKVHAPEIAQSRILAERTSDSAADSPRSMASTEEPTDDDDKESDDTITPGVESRVAWRESVKKQWGRMLEAHQGKCPPAKKIMAWFKANDQEGTFKPGGGDEEFLWVGADGKGTHKTGHKTFSNAIAEMKKRGEIPA
jgi:hypothetical protein